MRASYFKTLQGAGCGGGSAPDTAGHIQGPDIEQRSTPEALPTSHAHGCGSHPRCHSLCTRRAFIVSSVLRHRSTHSPYRPQQGSCWMGETLDVVRSLRDSWCKRVDPDGDEDAQWYRTMSHVAFSGRCADERIVKRIFDLAVQLNARRCRALLSDHAQHSPSLCDRCKPCEQCLPWQLLDSAKCVSHDHFRTLCTMPTHALSCPHLVQLAAYARHILLCSAAW